MPSLTTASCLFAPRIEVEERGPVGVAAHDLVEPTDCCVPSRPPRPAEPARHRCRPSSRGRHRACRWRAPSLPGPRRPPPLRGRSCLFGDAGTVGEPAVEHQALRERRQGLGADLLEPEAVPARRRFSRAACAVRPDLRRRRGNGRAARSAPPRARAQRLALDSPRARRR